MLIRPPMISHYFTENSKSKNDFFDDKDQVKTPEQSEYGVTLKTNTDSGNKIEEIKSFGI